MQKENRLSLLLSIIDNLLFVKLYGLKVNYDPQLDTDLQWKNVAHGCTKCRNLKRKIFF